MMTPYELLKRRIISEGKFKLSILKLVIDWTVALYIVIPALIAAGYYYSLWLSHPPKGFEILSVPIVLFLLYFFSFNGAIRIFIKSGDRIFLLGNRTWVEKITIYSLSYSAISYLIQSIILFIIFIPLFKYHHFTLLKVLVLLLFVYLAKVFWGLIKQFLAFKFKGFEYSIINFFLMIIGYNIFFFIFQKSLDSLSFLGIAVWVLLGIDAYLVKLRIKIKGTFLEDLVREEELSIKYFSILLSFSGIEIKKEKEKRKKPFLFSRSQNIFKRRNKVLSLVEVAIKATLREKKNLTQYLQISSICFFIVLTVPNNLKVGLWLGFSFMFPMYLGLYFKQIISVPFIKLFTWDSYTIKKAMEKYLFLMSIPGFSLVTLVLNISRLNIISFIMAVIFSTISLFFTSKIVASFYMLKNDKNYN